jgi:hypothetical protein
MTLLQSLKCLAFAAGIRTMQQPFSLTGGFIIF